jgi:acetylornithine/N-succinyldiaminopimelate aminotransferase
MQNDHVLNTYTRDTMMVRGQGSYLWDVEGRRYLDFTMGISVCNLGHCHPHVTAALCAQAGTLVHASNLFYNDKQPQLAKLIADHSFGGKVFFANSGAEANEGLIKLARRWGNTQSDGKNNIIAMENSFHGRTLATLAATGRSKYRVGFQPDMPGFDFATYNDLDSVKAKITPRTAAILVEPVLGEGGVVPATPQFLTGLRQLCDENNLLLLFDEVQTGMGRTGKFFAHQHFGVVPDAMSMAKALGNGIPLAAFEVQQRLADVLTPGTHASTFGGTPLACAAGIAVFETLEQDNVLANANAMGELFEQELTFLKAKHSYVTDIRRLGLMIGVDVGEKVKAIQEECRKRGLLVLTAGEQTLRLMPALTINREQVLEGIAILAEAMA